MSFYNIFSNKKTRENQNQIIADIHEKNSLVISELQRKGIKVKTESLEVGDYIIGKKVIERKTITDLQSSIISKRMFRQLKELQKYDSILIVEGNLNNMDGIINEQSLRGFILSMVLEKVIPIIFTENSEETAKYLSMITRKAKNNSISFRPSRSGMSDNEKITFILEGLPGVGPTTAKKLLEKFGSIKNIFSAKNEEIEKVLGKKSEKILHLINKKVSI